MDQINGTILSFEIEEFVVKMGLKYIDDDVTVYEKPIVN